MLHPMCSRFDTIPDCVRHTQTQSDSNHGRAYIARAVTRVLALSCGVICVIVHLAILEEHRLVTERHTDTPTEPHTVIA